MYVCNVTLEFAKYSKTIFLLCRSFIRKVSGQSPSSKIAPGPRLGLGFESRLGLVLGLGGHQTIAPEENCSLVRVKGWVKVTFGVYLLKYNWKILFFRGAFILFTINSNYDFFKTIYLLSYNKQKWYVFQKIAIAIEIATEILHIVSEGRVWSN